MLGHVDNPSSNSSAQSATPSAQPDDPAAGASKFTDPPTGSSDDEKSAAAPPPAGSSEDEDEVAPTGSSENEKEVAQGGVKRAASKGSKRKLTTTDKNRDPVDEKGVAGGKRQWKATAPKPLPPVVNSPRPLLPRQNRGPAAYLKENGYVLPKKGSHSRKND
jgi:hypothetical protein